MQPMQTGSLVIRMDGAFDIESVTAIRERIASLPAEAEVYVDLSRVREFHDRAVAQLAELLPTVRAHVSVHGLRDHHRRMLRYLGILPAAQRQELAGRVAALEG